MGDKSRIEWTDATWNPTTGCTKVSQGCKHCYAERFAKRMGYDFSQVELHPERLEIPLHWKKPRRIFVDSMSDLFHEDVPDEFIMSVFSMMMKTAYWHNYQVLTKRPERMMNFVRDTWIGSHMMGPIDYSPNVWLGVSVEDQATADERIPLLLQTPAAVRFVSCEPLLEEVDLIHLMIPEEEDWDAVNDIQDANGDNEPEEFIEECEAECDWVNFGNDLVVNPEWREWSDWRNWRAKAFALGRNIDWLIVGGESGPGVRPMHPDWACLLRDQCQTAGVPFFFKQWGEWAPAYELDHNPELQARILLGQIPEHDFKTSADGRSLTYRVGKKAAGRLLDGREWNEYPGGER